MTGSTPDLSRLRIDRDAPSANAGNGRRTFILIAAIVMVGSRGPGLPGVGDRARSR